MQVFISTQFGERACGTIRMLYISAHSRKREKRDLVFLLPACGEKVAQRAG